MFTAKAGVDSVTATALLRTSYKMAGSAHAAVAAGVFLAALVGAVRLWRRDRELAGYLLTVMAVGTLAIVAARPNWIMHPPVLARYLVPILPLVLLFAAEGAVALVPIPWAPARAMAVALAGVALWAWGPLPAQSYAPNQFTGHLRFQFDYDDAHNPYVQKAPRDPVPGSTASLRSRRRVGDAHRGAVAARVALQPARVVPAGAPAESDDRH